MPNIVKESNSSHYAWNKTLNSRPLIFVYANNPLYRYLFKINHNCLFESQ